MSLGGIDTDTGVKRLNIPHVKLESTALGTRAKPEGRPLPKPTASLDGFKTYLKRAAVIGYEPAPTSVLYEKLKIVLADNNILVYDDKVVDEWMTKMAKKDGLRTTWIWKSLTQPFNVLVAKKGN